MISQKTTHLTRSLARRARRREDGFSMVLTVLTLVGISTVGLASAMLADTVSKVSYRGVQKTSATTLAEAGLNAFYDTIRTTMVANNGTAFPAAPTSPATLNCTMNGKTYAVGTYTAQYVGTPSAGTPVDNGTQTTTTWTITIMGIGTSQNGLSTSKVQATFKATMIKSDSSSGGSASGGAGLGPGAIQSATTITMKTDGGIRTLDNSGGTTANVMANLGIGWLPYSQSRSNANPNVITAQGNFEVPASPSSAYTYTTSPTTGLYKATGSPIFQSATNSIVGLSSPISFPSSTQVATWQAGWLTQSQSTGNSTNGNVNASSITPNQSTGEHRITAPAYINGNLNVDSGQLYLQPSGTTSGSNVIYVTGNVNNGALLYNRGVVLVVQGQYNETSTSAMYQLQTQYSPYSSMTAIYGAAALVSLQASQTAINMYTSASSGPGLVYAANGGMTINGNNEIDGVLISGGTGSAGGINLYPQNGNSFVVKYHSEAVVGRTDFNLTGSATAGTVTQAFTPTRYTQWFQVQ